METKKTNAVLRFIDGLDVFITTIIIGAITLDVVLQIWTRLMPGNAIAWTNELGELLLGALIWFGLAAAVRNDCHIGFDLMVGRLSPRGKKIMGLINNTRFIIYLVVMAYLTWGLMQRYLRFNSATPILRINYFWARLPMVIGCVVGVVRLLIRQYLILTNRYKMYDRSDAADAALHVGAE